MLGEEMLGLSLTFPAPDLTKGSQFRSMRSMLAKHNRKSCTVKPVTWRVAVVQIGNRHLFEVPQERT